MQAAAGLNRSIFLQELRKFFKVGSDTTDEGLKDIARSFASGVEKINQAVANLQIDALAAVGEAIGTALAGGNLGDVFKNFANQLSEAIQSIGRQFIAMGVLAKTAKSSLATLFSNPAATIAVGVGFVAIGSAFKQLMSKGVPGFAQGGIVSGPTLGLIGEGINTSRSNPEVIAPLDKLRSMLADIEGPRSLQRVHVTGRLRGNDMLLQNARTGRRATRLGY